MGLRHGPDSYGRQQWGILRNGGNPDAATPREGRRFSDCKPLSSVKIVTVAEEEAPANYVPAAAVIRREQALSGFTGCKGCVGGIGKSEVKSMGLTHELLLKLLVLSEVEVGGIPGVAVKCVEIGRNTSGEGGLLGFN